MQDYNRYANVQDTGHLRCVLNMIANRVAQNRAELQRQLSALGGAPPPAEPYEIPESEDPAALQAAIRQFHKQWQQEVAAWRAAAAVARESSDMPVKKPALDFEGFIEERDRCRDASYKTPHEVLRDGLEGTGK